MDAERVAKLESVFRAVFEMPPDKDVRNLRQISERKWDSLAHVMLVSAIESEFGTTIDTGDALRMTSYAATQLVLEERGL